MFWKILTPSDISGNVIQGDRLVRRLFTCFKPIAHTSFGENGGCASGLNPAFLRAQVEVPESKIDENVHIVYEKTY